MVWYCWECGPSTIWPAIDLLNELEIQQFSSHYFRTRKTDELPRRIWDRVLKIQQQDLKDALELQEIWFHEQFPPKEGRLHV